MRFYRPAAVVAAVWLALAGLLAGVTARNARNLPFQDEWVFAPVLFGDHTPWGWPLVQHNEHWFISGRAVYLLAMTVGGNDFRSGMWVSWAFLAASGGLLVWAARVARGRSRLIDAGYPLLLLNAGHIENLCMGYQVVFTTTTLAGVAALAVAATAGGRSAARTIGLATPPVLVALFGGSPGLSLALPLTVWLGWLGLRAWRESWPAAVVGLTVPLLTVGYVGFAADHFTKHPTPHSHNPPLKAATVAWEFLTNGLGGAAERWPEWGYAVAGAYAVGIIGLATVWIRRPAERAVAGGLLAVIAGVFLMAAGAGWIRWSGWFSRYTCLSALGLAALGLTAVRYVRLPPAATAVATLGLLAALGHLYRGNWEVGKAFVFSQRHRADALLTDVRRAVPAELAAERNVLFPCPEYKPTFLALRAAGFRPLATTPDPPLTVVEVPVPPGGQLAAWQQGLPQPRLEVRLPTSQAVGAISFYYTCDFGQYWHDVRLSWVADDTPGSVVRTDSQQPWIAPGDGVLTFWVDGPVSRFWLVPLGPVGPMSVSRITLRTPAP